MNLEAQPPMPAAAWEGGGTGNEHFLILIESIVQNIFFYYMKSCITSEVKSGSGTLHQQQMTMENQIELERQTYWKKAKKLSSSPLLSQTPMLLCLLRKAKI